MNVPRTDVFEHFESGPECLFHLRGHHRPRHACDPECAYVREAGEIFLRWRLYEQCGTNAGSFENFHGVGRAGEIVAVICQ